MDASTDDNEHPELFDHLTADNRRRLRHILATRVVDVHNAIRGAETQTHLESSIGRVNLNEAFSHVGELASNTDLSAVDQASHLADIEDHLRRAVMEHPEQVVRGKIVEIEERWEEYLLDARSYRETKAMLGVPYHSELEDDRENIEALVNEARGMKTSRMEWDATLDIAAKLTDAARVARKLDDKLVQCSASVPHENSRLKTSAIGLSRSARMPQKSVPGSPKPGPRMERLARIEPRPGPKTANVALSGQRSVRGRPSGSRSRLCWSPGAWGSGASS